MDYTTVEVVCQGALVPDLVGSVLSPNTDVACISLGIPVGAWSAEECTKKQDDAVLGPVIDLLTEGKPFHNVPGAGPLACQRRCLCKDGILQRKTKLAGEAIFQIVLPQAQEVLQYPHD